MLSLEEDRVKAVSLRQDGASVKGIAKELVRSPATISKWVKHVVLSEGQREALASLSHGGRKHLVATRTNQAKCAAMRQSFREKGRIKAAEGDVSHAMACALYWAEGTKKRNALTFCNTDPAMVKMFYDFLTSTFAVKPKVQFSYHEGEGNIPAEQAGLFWSTLLGCPLILLKGSSTKIRDLGLAKRSVVMLTECAF